MGRLTDHPPGLRIRRGRWHYRFVVDGVEYAASTRLKATSSNASKALRMLEQERQRVLVGEPSSKLARRAFSDAADLFLDWVKHEYPKASTAERMRVDLVSARAYFSGAMMHQLTSGSVEDYKTWRRSTGIKDVTLYRDLVTLRQLCRYARKQGWLRGDPFDGVKMPSLKDATRQHVVTAAEEMVYFAAARALRPELADIAELILLTGMRPSEVMRLTKFDFDGTTVMVQKGKSDAARRRLTLVPAAAAILERRAMTPGPWMFQHPKDVNRHIVQVGTSHATVLQRTGLRLVLYDFRHTFATRMAEAGAPLATLAAILGHCDLRTLHRYVHPTQGAQDAAMRQYGATTKQQEEARA